MRRGLYLAVVAAALMQMPSGALYADMIDQLDLKSD